MFGLGATELLLIVVVALVLLGTGKLPDLARKAGGAYRSYRKVDEKIHQMKNPATWIEVVSQDVNDDKNTQDPPVAK